MGSLENLFLQLCLVPVVMQKLHTSLLKNYRFKCHIHRDVGNSLDCGFSFLLGENPHPKPPAHIVTEQNKDNIRGTVLWLHIYFCKQHAQVCVSCPKQWFEQEMWLFAVASYFWLGGGRGVTLPQYTACNQFLKEIISWNLFLYTNKQ